jgi:hypothetical protein
LRANIAISALATLGALCGGCGGRTENGSAADAATPILDSSIAQEDAGGGDDGGAVEDSRALDASAAPDAVSFGDGGLDEPCRAGGNLFFVDDYPEGSMHIGPLRLDSSAGMWSGSMAGNWTLQVSLWLTDTTYGDAWIATFSTQGLRVPLEVRRYDNVELAPGESSSHAGMAIDVGYQSCGSITGWFEIKELDTSPDPMAPDTPHLRGLLATFEQHCDGAAALRGCVSFRQP